ncbi:MAG: YitT family protein, partial [Ruminococcus sp.]|nr:YitT family protein [Ruminococcus sp.]
MTKVSKQRKIFKTVLIYFTIIAIACGMALCYQIFIFENSFAPAGINGIATMIQYKLHFSVAYMSLLINIPLCVLAFIFLDKGFAARTTVFALTFSVALLLLQFKVIDLSFLSYKTANGTSTILAPIASGVINGIIYGAAIRLNGCTGGTDIVAALIHKKWPEQNLIWIIFALNTGVAIASYFVYDLKVEPVVLCIIYSFLTSQVGDTILRGSRQRIKFEIVSNESKAISDEIIYTL